jgi:Domain of unknown function (DUF4349)
MSRIRLAALGTGLLVVGIVAAGCSGTDRALSGGSDGGGGSGEAALGHTDRFRAQDRAIATAIQRLPSARPSVIKTASLEIAVGRDDLQGAIQEATAAAGRFGGFVLSTSTDEEGARSGTITLRVPAERFEAALADIESLGEVEDETVSGEDVSQQFVDLEARLRNWRTQEAVLLRLMGRADTIGQTIRVQSELQRVQLEIERITGRLRYLEDQTTLSTITASFVAKGVPAASKPSTIEVAARRAVELSLQFAAALIVSLGVIVPLALLTLLGVVVFRSVRPRLSG